MDWDRVDKEVLLHVQSLVNDRRPLATTSNNPSINFGASNSLSFQNSYINNNNNYSREMERENNSYIGNYSISEVHDNTSYYTKKEPNISHNNYPIIEDNDNTTDVMMKDIKELRAIIIQQNKKLNTMEKMFTTYSDVLETSSTSQVAFSERIDQIEYDIRNNNKALHTSAREKSDFAIQNKSLQSRIQSLEDFIRDQSDEYATKDSFSQLLDTTVDQIKQLGSIADIARTKSAQSISLVEALIAAFHELKGTGASGFKLDFLTSLSGDRQRDQVVRLLLDSLQNSIGQSVRGQVSRATEEISAQFRSIYDDLIKTQAQSLESTNNQCLSITTGVSTKVDKCYETINKFEQEIINTKKLYASFDGGLNNIRESCNLYESNLQHVKESIAGQQTLLEMLQGTSHQSRQVHVTELQSMREMISTLQNTIISIESGQRVLRSDNESKRKDTADEIERIQNTVSESNRVNQRGLDSLRLEMSEGLSAITTANAHAHAQSKRVSLEDPIYKRCEELETKLESKLNSLEKSLRDQTANYNEINNEISLMKQYKPAPVVPQVQMKYVSNDDPLYQRCELLESKISNSDKSSRQQAQQITSLGDELTSISTTTQLQRQTQAQAQLRITSLEAHIQRPIASDDPLYKRCEHLEGKIANIEKSMREQQRDSASIVNNSAFDSTSNLNNRTLNQVETINFKQTEDNNRKIQDIAIKLNQLDQSVAKILLQNLETQDIHPEKVSTITLDSIIGIQNEITILHNAFDKVTDEQEKTKLQISQLVQRIEFLDDADKSHLENQDNIVTNELSKIKLDIENIKKITVTKLQAEIIDKFDTLSGSHKRIQQGVDILQEELSNVSDTIALHDERIDEQKKKSSIISENLLQLKEKGCNVANRCISNLNEKDITIEDDKINQLLIKRLAANSIDTSLERKYNISMPSPNNSNPNSPKLESNKSPTKVTAKFSSFDVLPPPPLNQAIGGHGLITPKQRSLLEASKSVLITATTTNNLATGSAKTDESESITTKSNVNVGIKKLPSLTDNDKSDNDRSEEDRSENESEDESKSDEGSDIFDFDAEDNEEPESESPSLKATTNDIKEKSSNQESENENNNTEELKDENDSDEEEEEEEEGEESSGNVSSSSSDEDIYEGKKIKDTLLKTKYPSKSPNKSKNDTLNSEKLTANSDKLLTDLEDKKNGLPTPSDVLQAHLKEGKELERNRALANSRAKTPSKSKNSFNNNLLDSPPKKDKDESSPKPILSGSLLGGRTGGGRIASLNNNVSKQNELPLYSTLGSIGNSKNSISPPSPPHASAVVSTTAAAKRTASISNNNNTVQSREDSMQCPHCLKRCPKTEITTHTRSCDLRTEVCKLGCGAKVRFIKMNAHLEGCPNRKPSPEMTSSSLENSFDSSDDDEDVDEKSKEIPKSEFAYRKSLNISDKKQKNDEEDD